MNKNSLDLLRLVAAAMVLYSHQYALLGLAEPSFLGWNTFGGAGVTIFFFLSGYLVWSSWDRDPHFWRFFQRRSLRIFPALWVVVLLSVFVLGPVVSVLSLRDYFASPMTWSYLGTAVLVPARILPGLFTANHFPLVVNGSLWTLPVEFMCYCTIAGAGLVMLALKLKQDVLLGVALVGVVLVASYGPPVIGSFYTPHLEMVAVFWWGAFYGFCLKTRPKRVGLALVLAALAFIGFALLGPRGLERAAMLLLAALLVHLARNVAAGARMTDPLGDLSYGVYIFAFPVQQLGAHYGRGLGWSFNTYLCVSLLATLGLAYASWHGVEKRALWFKPASRSIA
ncbi:MAG: acyltransferase [Rhodoferax sp.]|nr:acyltransferase [Rhodoferax sp.]